MGIQAPTKRKLVEHIPCLHLPFEEGGNKLILYFHGNAEDIGLAFDLLYMFGKMMRMHVLAIEYPGYGLYKTSKADEQQIKEDAETIYDLSMGWMQRKLAAREGADRDDADHLLEFALHGLRRGTAGA